MKRSLIITVVFYLATSLSAYAQTPATDAAADKKCASEMKKAKEKAAKDKECQKDATDFAGKLTTQIELCKDFRALKRTCRQAKRASVKVCKAAKKDCRRANKVCKSKCKRGRKGKNCRRACSTPHRKCKAQARSFKKKCKAQARAEKKKCKAAAKATQEFVVCKDARKLTRKALGKTVKCAGKYFSKPVMICISELFKKEE